MLKTHNLQIRIQRAGDNEVKTFECGLGKFHADVMIRNGGMPSKEQCNVNIYGVGRETIKNFSFLVFNNTIVNPFNMLEIIADDSLVFRGNYISSFGDFSQVPNISLKLNAVVSYAESFEKKPNTVIMASDNRSVESVFKQLADDMQFNYINGGVNMKCPDIVLSGSSYSKAWQLAKDLGLRIVISDRIIAFAPKGQPINKIAVNINKGNGLIGYPSFTQTGITFRTLYNPLIRLGYLVKIESDMPGADGNWQVKNINTNLSTKTGGEWASEVICCVHN